jgi:lysophospholipase L1-like esterase
MKFWNIGIILLILLTACQGALPADDERDVNTNMSPTLSPPSMVKPMRFLALGDSYTIGESVPEVERWPVQLVGRLRQEGLAFSDPQIIARTGWTTGELADGIEQAEVSPPYDLVSLLIGVNNQYRGYPQEAYREEFASLLDQAIIFAGGDPQRVLVLSIPDWGVTPFAAGSDVKAIAADIDAFNAINREESERRGVHSIDVTPLSRQAAEDPSLIAADGLHPSGKMYSGWVELALPAAFEALNP